MWLGLAFTGLFLTIMAWCAIRYVWKDWDKKDEPD